MKKIAFILAMTFIASSYAAENACQRNCDSSFAQNGLMCSKILQICIKRGPVGSEGSDMCFDDYQECVGTGKINRDACYESCEEQN